MAALTLNGSTSGSVTLQPPAVAGSNTLTIPAATGTVIVTTGTTANQIFFGGASSGTFAQDSNLFWDNSNKRLGVGTATPSYDFQLQKAGVTSAYIYNSMDAVGVRLLAYTNAGYIQTQTNHPLYFAVNNGSPAIAIGTDGSVGIGTTSPAGRLTVAYSTNGFFNTGLSVVNTNSGSAAGASFQLTNDAGNRAGFWLTSSTCGYYYGTNTANIGTVDSIGLSFIIGNSPRMYLDTSGNVGIGSSPNAWSMGGPTLQIGGYAAISTNSARSYMNANCYWNGSNWLRQAALPVVQQIYDHNSGSFVWNTASTGIAGSTIGFTQGMALDVNSRLAVGPNVSASNQLEVSNNAAGSAVSIRVSNTNTSANSDASVKIGTPNGDFEFRALRSGNALGIWTASGNQHFNLTNSGNFQFLGADAGIVFNKTSALTNSTLNDYEEGTATPTLGTTTGTPTYTYQEASYVKIGKLVRYAGLIGISNSSSLTGTININLPFAAAASSYGSAAGMASDGTGFTWPISGVYNIQFQVNGGASTAAMICVGGGASIAIAYNSSGVASTWYFRFCIVYKTSS